MTGCGLVLRGPPGRLRGRRRPGGDL